MGRILLFALILMGVLFSRAIVTMNKQTTKLPQVAVDEMSSKESRNLSNYAIRYALQFSETQNFSATPGFTRKQSFNNFYYKCGYIDSIRYSYVASANHFMVKAYTRTIIAGKSVTHCSIAAMKGLTMSGGIGNLAHWRYDSNLLDSSGNNNNGTGYSNRYKNNAVGGSSLDLNGSSAYVTIPDSPTLDMPVNFSWTVWANWNSNPNGYVPIMEKQSLPSNTTYRNEASYSLWTYQDYLHCGILTQNMEWIEAVSAVTVKPQGNWHLINVTYNGATIKLYYDGSFVGSAMGTGGCPYNSSELLNTGRICRNGTWIYFKGRLDETGFYNYVFTDEQIAAIWNSNDGILPSVSGTPVVDYIKE
ncbi:MAG TPA: LamG domain-containing protein [Candidatus Cloacimonadota bacterium]|nr:LamG domain-containing protein [Candidatus Cloacimonadota bacterium]HPT71448.1 LamG domain-containing protein [Candidatus Cloacimonadota bacterium]